MSADMMFWPDNDISRPKPCDPESWLGSGWHKVRSLYMMCSRFHTTKDSSLSNLCPWRFLILTFFMERVNPCFWIWYRVPQGHVTGLSSRSKEVSVSSLLLWSFASEASCSSSAAFSFLIESLRNRFLLYASYFDTNTFSRYHAYYVGKRKELTESPIETSNKPGGSYASAFHTPIDFRNI